MVDVEEESGEGPPPCTHSLGVESDVESSLVDDVTESGTRLALSRLSTGWKRACAAHVTDAAAFVWPCRGVLHSLWPKHMGVRIWWHCWGSREQSRKRLRPVEIDQESDAREAKGERERGREIDERQRMQEYCCRQPSCRLKCGHPYPVSTACQGTLPMHPQPTSVAVSTARAAGMLWILVGRVYVVCVRGGTGRGARGVCVCVMRGDLHGRGARASTAQRLPFSADASTPPCACARSLRSLLQASHAGGGGESM